MPRVIVVGSGIAGITTALTADAGGADVVLITKADLPETNTRYAQGGIAAALFDDDSVAAHVADTLSVGGGINDEDAVRALCGEGPARVRELIARGVRFDMQSGRFARGLEAAHSAARVLHAGGDATGAAIEHALVGALGRSRVAVHEHTMLTDLVVADGRVIGVDTIGVDRTGAGLLDDGDRRERRLVADAVVLASGGAGRLYAHTTNPQQATGDGVAAAWRAGARLTDLEFYQFHPTALAVPGGFLVSEAVRGEGAVLRNAHGERFMTGVHREAELAPRDVVARAIAAEMEAQGGSPVLLDATGLGRRFLATRFPTIDRACRDAGLDWSREPVPVTPAAHYWMGGIATDLHARTSLPGLYAAGEAACTGVHGANRLASNSLLEGAVFGHRAALDVLATGGEARAGTPRASDAGGTEPQHPFGLEAEDAGNDGSRSRADVAAERATLQSLMWNGAGVQRSGAGLASTAERLRGLAAAGQRPAGTGISGGTSAGPSSGSGTAAEHENRNLICLAGLLVDSALQRRESRGAHFRTDFPAASGRFERHVIRERHAAPADQNTATRTDTMTTDAMTTDAMTTDAIETAREVPTPC